MRISEKLKQFTMGATLTVALTFLIVHPGMFATVNAHYDSANESGEPVTGSTLFVHSAFYLTPNCSGAHQHLSVMFPMEKLRFLQKRRKHSYREMTRVNNSGNPYWAEGNCINLCPSYAQNYLNCFATVTGLGVLAADLGLGALATFKIPPLSWGLGLGALAVTVTAWFIWMRCNRKKPDAIMCPQENAELDRLFNQLGIG